jgi:hypothetical protein
MAPGYFDAPGLVYGFMAAFVILFSAYRGRATAPLLVNAIVLAGGWMLPSASARLAVLSCRRFQGYWSVNAGDRFAFRPPNRRVLMLSG